jgi:AsmA protein
LSSRPTRTASRPPRRAGRSPRIVRYADERTGAAEEVEAIDARIALASISGPLDAKGSLVWRAEPLAFDARLTSPKALAEDRPARLALKLTGRPIELDYDGAVTLGRVPETEGTIAAKSAAVRTLLQLFGVAAADTVAITMAQIGGRLKVSEAAMSLSDATISLDQFGAQGTIAIEQRPVRPMVRGNLQIAELDLNRLTLPAVAAAPGASPPARPRAQPPGKAAPATAPRSIEDLLRDPAPKPGARVQGFTRRAGWSDDVIDLSAFRLLDADIKLSLGRLLYREIKVGPTQMRIALKDRTLTATFDDIQLYDGRGSGLVRIDGAGAQPAIGANFSVDGTSALALLKDAADFDWVAGRAKVSLAVGGQGASERQIVGSRAAPTCSSRTGPWSATT